MTAARSDVAVIGGGVMGLAVARAFARQGRSATLFEAGELFNRHGGSHGKARIVRLSYGDPLYARLAKQAFAGWDELGAAAGQQMYRTTGSLDIDLTGRETFDGHRNALSSVKAAFRTVTGAEVNEAYRELRRRECQILCVRGSEDVLSAQRAEPTRRSPNRMVNCAKARN